VLLPPVLTYDTHQNARHIHQERLEREYEVDLIVTAPSVVYMTRAGVHRAEHGEIKPSQIVETLVDTPHKLPDPSTFDEVLEPYVRLEIMTPTEYTGALMELGQSRRGIFVEMKYLTPTRTALIYEMPLAEVITDFFDRYHGAVLILIFAPSRSNSYDYLRSDTNLPPSPPIHTVSNRVPRDTRACPSQRSDTRQTSW
jgi:hypothetical protein